MTRLRGKFLFAEAMQFLDESTSLGANFSLFFAESLFHDLTRNTQSKRIFFLTDTILTDSFRLYAI